MATRRKAAPKKAAVKNVEAEAPAVEEIKEEKAVKVVNSTVTVCLNFPLDIKYKIVDKNGKEQSIVFNGNGTPLKGKAKGVLPVGAYGLTPNVPKAVWDYIVKTRPDDPLIKKGLLFAESGEKAAAAAAERAALRNGFEPVKVK